MCVCVCVCVYVCVCVCVDEEKMPICHGADRSLHVFDDVLQ